MLWYKNKRTGKTWNVTDEALLKRLETDEDFDSIAEPTPMKEAKGKKE